MKIGDVSERVGLPVKTIRYYEEIGLIVPQRQSNGYRIFSDGDLQHLQLVGRARRLGFDIEECRSLLALYDDERRASADVKVIARAKLDDIDRKIAELESLRKVLAPLVQACNGDDKADCAILDGFVTGDKTAS